MTQQELRARNPYFRQRAREDESDEKAVMAVELTRDAILKPRELQNHG